MHDDNELIYSPLQRHYTEGEVTVEICIYRTLRSSWTLEVIDEHGNSTVWEDEFATDQAAFDEAMQTIRTDGIASLIGEPRRAAETKGDLASGGAQADQRGVRAIAAGLMDDAPSLTRSLEVVDGLAGAISQRAWGGPTAPYR